MPSEARSAPAPVQPLQGWPGERTASREAQAPQVDAGTFAGSTADGTAVAQVCACNRVNSVGRRIGNQRLDIFSFEITKSRPATQDRCCGVASRKKRSRASVRKFQ